MSDTISGRIIQRKGLHTVFSRIKSYDTDQQYNEYTKDDYGNNVRVTINNVNSSGIGVGGYIEKSSPAEPWGCGFQEVRLEKTSNGEGYGCSLLDEMVCPALGGVKPIRNAFPLNSRWYENTDQPVTMVCEYSASAIAATEDGSGVLDWIEHFESSSSALEGDLTHNRNQRYEKLMLPFCSSTSKHCSRTGPYYKEEEPLDQCSRFSASGRDDGSEYDADDGGLACSEWGLVPYTPGQDRDSGRITRVGESMANYCEMKSGTEGTDAPFRECWCEFRHKDPSYKSMKEFSEFSDISLAENRVNCFWNPCTDGHPEEIADPVNDCPPDTNLTFCMQIVFAANEGDVYADWIGEMKCGNEELPDTGGGKQPGQDGVDWGDVSTWPWWIWLIIALGGLAVILVLYFILRPSPKPTTTEFVISAPPMSDAMAGYSDPYAAYAQPSASWAGDDYVYM